MLNHALETALHYLAAPTLLAVCVWIFWNDRRERKAQRERQLARQRWIWAERTYQQSDDAQERPRSSAAR